MFSGHDRSWFTLIEDNNWRFQARYMSYLYWRRCSSICCSHRGENVDVVHWVCDTIWTCLSIPSFQRNTLPITSKLKTDELRVICLRRNGSFKVRETESWCIRNTSLLSHQSGSEWLVRIAVSSLIIISLAGREVFHSLSSYTVSKTVKVSHSLLILASWGEEVQLLLFLNLGSRRVWVVSFTPRPRFTPGERAPGTHCTGGWVGPRAEMCVVCVYASACGLCAWGCARSAAVLWRGGWFRCPWRHGAVWVPSFGSHTCYRHGTIRYHNMQIAGRDSLAIETEYCNARFAFIL
jgi:hypothetical protein